MGWEPLWGRVMVPWMFLLIMKRTDQTLVFDTDENGCNQAYIGKNSVMIQAGSGTQCGAQEGWQDGSRGCFASYFSWRNGWCAYWVPKQEINRYQRQCYSNPGNYGTRVLFQVHPNYAVQVMFVHNITFQTWSFLVLKKWFDTHTSCLISLPFYLWFNHQEHLRKKKKKKKSFNSSYAMLNNSNQLFANCLLFAAVQTIQKFNGINKHSF